MEYEGGGRGGDDSFKRPGAVPFKWELQPGVPKQPISPPTAQTLTPPAPSKFSPPLQLVRAGSCNSSPLSRHREVIILKRSISPGRQPVYGSSSKYEPTFHPRRSACGSKYEPTFQPRRSASPEERACYTPSTGCFNVKLLSRRKDEEGKKGGGGLARRVWPHWSSSPRRSPSASAAEAASTRNKSFNFAGEMDMAGGWNF